MPQKDTVAIPVLSYAAAPSSRRWSMFAFLIAVAVGQFSLLFVLSFHRDKAFINAVARILEFPLLRVAFAFDIPLPGFTVYFLGLLNGLCWAAAGIVIVRCIWRRLTI